MSRVIEVLNKIIPVLIEYSVTLHGFFCALKRRLRNSLSPHITLWLFYCFQCAHSTLLT